MQKSKPRNVVKNKSAFSGKQWERVIHSNTGENNKMAHLIENLIGRSREVCSLTQTPTVDRHTAPSQNPLCMDVWEGVIKIIKIIGSVSAWDSKNQSKIESSGVF